VGNKCDAVDKIAVNTNLAQKFADGHNMPLFETSAKDDTRANHVEAIFMTIAHKLKNSRPMMPAHLADYVPGDTGGSGYVELRGSPRHRGLQSATHREGDDGEKSDCAC
jgi:Ras-related protein Rab-33B